MISDEKGLTPTIVTWQNSRKANKKSDILKNVFTWFMVTKLNKQKAYGIGHHPQSCMILWSRDYIMQSHDKKITLYL